MVRTTILVLIVLLTACISTSYVLQCVTCVEQDKVFIKSLSFNSPVPYQCVSNERYISGDIIVIGRACNKWQCLHINRESRRVYNKTNLCTENLSCEADYSSSGGKVVFSLNLLHLLFYTYLKL